ncbi:MAG: hypothetical protein MUE78_09990 [Ilumatobacteraceae bacterium]|jgi:hypothetical protein|nr:hypothetical protein [Ilumatobacteraceae bacterium]
MLLWFVGTAVLTIAWVFRDPRFDYRLLVVGSVLPQVVDVWTGGAWVMHSLLAPIVTLVVVMLATIGRRQLRRTLLGLPIGMLLYLVFSGAWANEDVFWWPFTGTGFDGDPLPAASRGWWTLVLEAAGLGLCVFIWRTARLGDPERRAWFRRTGQLDLARVVH